MALAAYTETRQKAWLKIYLEKNEQFALTLKKIFKNTNDSFLLKKLFEIEALYASILDSYKNTIQKMDSGEYTSAQSLFGGEFYRQKIRIFKNDLDSFVELDNSPYTLQKVLKNIEHLNDELRLFVRFAVLSKNSNWEIPYNQEENEQAFLFEQASLLIAESNYTADPHFQYFGSKSGTYNRMDEQVVTFLEEANNNVLNLERKAFEALKHNNANEAFSILAGKKYKQHIDLYQNGLWNLKKILNTKKEFMLKNESFNLITKIISIVIVLIILPVVWRITLYTYRKVYIQLLGSKHDLEVLNSTLAEKVEESTKEIIRRSFTDELTGLPNRLQLDSDLTDKQWRAMAIMNIDHFSNYKAAFGPHLANIALFAIAEKLSTILKGKGNLYKLSYDEFVFLTKDINIIHQLLVLINNQINNPAVTVEDIHLHVSLGIGVVIDEETELLRKANLALINAKKNGPGNILIYERQFDITKEYKNNIEWIKKVQYALENDSIIPYFQGIRNNKTGVIDKYECLIRLKEYEQIIAPINFLEPARQAGLLPKLTERMLDKSFTTFKNTSLDFSINISKEDLIDANFLSLLTQKSHTYGIDSGRVTFEVLESMSFEAHASLSEELKKIKGLGFKLAIDDFGTAYSNFARLIEMNIDFLKIDGSFIKNIDTNKRSFEIVKSITSFCHNLNIKLIAEFVHSESVQKVVENLGIDYSQGYYFSIPKGGLC
jgi:diguanylate cyclase (GGDEF)-like protein